MNSRFASAETIFMRALGRPTEERTAFVDSACRGDAELRLEVLSLLSYHAKPLGVLDRPLTALRREALAAPGPVEPGQRIGSYSIMSLLGSGGMGTVYLAHDSRLGRKVALKFLAAGEQSASRLEREVKAISALNHPNILTIHDVGEWEGQPFLVSEYVEGETVRQFLARGPLGQELILGIARQTASALEAAHAAGFVHRDIKPENIMVRGDGLVKVLDFGLAKRTGEAEPASTGFKTRTGEIIGTAAYMSPEQLTGQAPDSRADLWSLGVVLLEMTTGKSPFWRSSVPLTIGAILAPEPVSVPVAATHARVIERCLKRNLDERYQTAAGLIEDLNQAAEPSSNRRAKPWPRHLATALTCLCFATMAWSNRRPPQPFPVESVTRFTVQGRPGDAAISADGQYIAYVSLESNQPAVWIRQAGAESDVRIIPRRPVRYAGLAFAPDGKSLFYAASEPGSPAMANLHRIAVIGGQSRLVLKNVDSAPSFSPDESRFAFLRGAADGTTQVVIGTTDGQERVLATRRPPRKFQIAGVAWSPVRDEIAVIANEKGKGNGLVTIGLADGKETPVGRQSWEYASRPAWINHGRALLMLALGDPRPVLRAVQVSYPDGEIRELFPNDPNYYRGLSVASDPPSLVTLRAETLTAIWESGDPDHTRAITTNAGRYAGIAWLRDGGVVTQADLSGRPDLWRISGDGSGRVRLTDDSALESNPVVCGNEETIVFRSNKSGRWNLWRVGADGSGLRPVTTGAGPDANPSCGPGSQWVYYTSFQSGVETIWKAALTGGEETRVTQFVSRRVAVSPDAERLATFAFDSAAGGNVAIVRASDGVILSRIAGIPYDAALAWHPNGNEIAYVLTEKNVSNVVARRLDGGGFRKITHFDTEQISGFAWRHDGKKLACVRGIEQHDLVRAGANLPGPRR